MNSTHHLDLLINAEPCAWLLLLVALYLGSRRADSRTRKGRLRSARVDEAPPSYTAFIVFAGLRLLSTCLYPVFVEWRPFGGMSAFSMQAMYYLLFWLFYIAATVSVLFVIEGLIRSSLKALPGLVSLVIPAFRWASAIAFLIALTAHLPVLHVIKFNIWMDEVSYSFVVCICSFELTLLSLLFTRIRPLGMCFRSRPVGFGIGLTMMGFMDLITAAEYVAPSRYLVWLEVVNQITILTAIAIWIYYIILPEPLRKPHSLSQASRLMKWNDIAIKLELNGKQAETVPFISGVESVVVGILKKHNIGSEP